MDLCLDLPNRATGAIVLGTGSTRIRRPDERLRLRVAVPLSPRNASDMRPTDLDASADYHFATADPLTKRAHVKRRATVFLAGERKSVV